MHLVFSRRQRARQAAIAAHRRWEDEMRERVRSGQPILEYWTYVVDAALEAAVGDLPEPRDPLTRP